MQNDFYQQLLANFFFSPSGLFIAIDPDGIFEDVNLLTTFKENGFQILRYENPIEFRYQFEKSYRTKKGKNDGQKFLILFPNAQNRKNELPYDILKNARIVSLGLADLFPGMDISALRNLPGEFYAQLFRLRSGYAQERLGQKASIDFIFTEIFGLEPGLICDEKTLLISLLKLHQQNTSLPELYSQHLLQKLSKQAALRNLPLKELIFDRSDFFHILQHSWEVFIRQIEEKPLENQIDQGWVFNPDLFKIFEVQALVKNYFHEGNLKPVKSELVFKEKAAWYLAGLQNVAEYQQEKIAALNQLIQPLLESSSTQSYQVWFKIAQLWAEIKSTFLQIESFDDPQILQTETNLSDQFETWIRANFDSLLSLPPVQPVLVHHIPQMIARQLRQNCCQKSALIVLDGMAYWQWLIIKNGLLKHSKLLNLKSQAVFAWIPSITAVSRQAIFSGLQPQYFSESILHTNQESKLWETFWQKEGYQENEIQYFRNIENKNIFTEILPQNKILGLVINTVDEIMHGNVLGEKGMLSHLQQWSEGDYFCSLLNALISQGYKIWLTSDHGNLETTQQIKLSEGALAASAGERVRVYQQIENRKIVANTADWSSASLPDDYYPLLAKDKYSFSKQSGKIITHGGASLEEVIVPLIEIGEKYE